MRAILALSANKQKFASLCVSPSRHSVTISNSANNEDNEKTLFALLGFLFITLAAQAQEDGANLAKQAGEALTRYNIDPTANAAKLDEANKKLTKHSNWLMLKRLLLLGSPKATFTTPTPKRYG